MTTPEPKHVNDMTDAELNDLLDELTYGQAQFMLRRFAGYAPEAFDRALAAVKAGDAG